MKRHILIASEQLWPNLLGLAALHSRDQGIKSLEILHTSDKIRSRNPANRLRSMARKMFPGIEVNLHLTGSTSQEVYCLGRSLICGTTDSEWTINCSGGTKTMFGGLLPLSRLPGVEAFYREVNGEWYYLRPQDGDIQLSVCEEWPDAKFAIVDLPVDVIATIQSEAPTGSTWNHKSPPELDILKFVEDAIHTKWHWSQLQTRWPMLAQENSGWAFEDFFGALLLACGASNTVIGLKLEENNQVRHEFDVIVSNGKKVVIFDLKLTDDKDDAVIDQLSRLAEDSRHLGGLAGDAVAVRPSWTANDSIRKLASVHNSTKLMFLS